ncbi:MAG: hypothetical protein U1E86_07570 [Burkholderiaceae bacterium]
MVDFGDRKEYRVMRVDPAAASCAGSRSTARRRVAPDWIDPAQAERQHAFRARMRPT